MEDARAQKCASRESQRGGGRDVEPNDCRLNRTTADFTFAGRRDSHHRQLAHSQSSLVANYA